LCGAILSALEQVDTLSETARTAAVRWRAERSIDQAFDLMLDRRAAAASA
jgi:hypothetical protein